MTLYLPNYAHHLREMVGELHGHTPPPSEVLQRLYDMNPNYRVTWEPGGVVRVVSITIQETRPALWALHEIRPNNVHDRLRRIAAGARVRRWEAASKEWRDAHPKVPMICRDMLAGYWRIGEWPERAMRIQQPNGRHLILPPFGSDLFFRELQESEHTFAAEAARLALHEGLNNSADDQTLAELDENDAFREAASEVYRQAAVEDWGMVCAGAKGVLFEKTLKGATVHA